MNRLLLLVSAISLLTFGQVMADNRPQGPDGVPSYVSDAAGLSAPGTYLLGGLLFTGDHPLNNPVNTGDLGYAMLYRIDGDAVVPIDTVVVDTLGYFYFLDLVPGRYLVKAGLSAQSPNYAAYIPTYYGGGTRWNMTDTVALNAHFYNADIHLHHVEVTDDGFGHIRGFITMAGSTVNDSREPWCEVVLANAQEIPVGYTFADANGNFGFEKLPAGDYRIWADLTGKYSQKISHKITSILPFADSIEVKLSNVVQGIGIFANAPDQSITFYPNPASDRITLHYTGERSRDYSFSFYSLSGEQVLTGVVAFAAAVAYNEIDISGLPSGIYSLVFRSADSREVIFQKVMKK